jgi:hypothetical protein
VIADLLGHTTPVMAQRYTHGDEEETARAALALPRLAPVGPNRVPIEPAEVCTVVEKAA